LEDGALADGLALIPSDSSSTVTCTVFAYHCALTVDSVGSRELCSRISRPPTFTKTWCKFLQQLDTRESTASGTMSLNLEKQLRFVRHT
jgi:hypothetical protein